MYTFIKCFSIIFFYFSFGFNSNCPNSYVLVQKPNQLIGCGGILFAGQFVFTNVKDTTEIICIIKCPDGYGESFFKEKNKYKIEFSKDSVLSKDYSLINVFDIPANKKVSIKIVEKIEQVKED
ncbi:MAG: hypothetical protein KA319_01875 [Ferruginibacter sp.]|nr:hypothetical protein [Ferruginibacter sp.]